MVAPPAGLLGMMPMAGLLGMMARGKKKPVKPFEPANMSGFHPEMNPEMGGSANRMAEQQKVADMPAGGAEAGGGFNIDPSMRAGLMAMAATLLQARDKGQSLGGALGEGLLNMQQAQAYMSQQDDQARYRKATMEAAERNAKNDETAMAAEQQRQAQLQAEIAKLPPDQQAVAMANPDAFFKARAEQMFAAPKPNQTRNIVQGGMEVTQEFDPGTGKWNEIGSGPRWAPQQPAGPRDLQLVQVANPDGTISYVPEAEAIGRSPPPRANSGGITIGPDGTVQIGGDARKLTPTEINLKDETQSAVTSGEQAISALDRAKELNDKAPDGLLAPLKQAWNFIANEDGYNAGVEYQNVIGKQALASLKDIFGGNPTEGERTILLQLEASLSQPREVRQAILERAYEAAKIRLEQNRTKLGDLTTGRYGVTQPAAPAAPPPPSGFVVQ